MPYVLRAGLLGVTFVIAFAFMRDIGFTPAAARASAPRSAPSCAGSIDGGLRNPPVRWLMLSAPFTAGVGIFAFYALQPYLLQLYGDPTAYGIAGLAAAIVAGGADRRRADRAARPAPVPAPDRRPARRGRRDRRAARR